MQTTTEQQHQEQEQGRELRRFNRYEIKYLLDPGTADAVRAELAQRLPGDRHGVDGAYGVQSLYYDTAGLRFYWEKIEGLRFRRKLRIRHYGDAVDLRPDTPVFVEIKQRVNRVTQKRRVRVPYRLATDLCDGRRAVEVAPADRPLVEEVLDLVLRLDLRPVAITSYRREAFVGTGVDTGLRVTMDRRVSGRDRDFALHATAENRFIVPPDLCVLEVKANERLPYWATDLTARHNLQLQRISKYCQSVEAFGRAPRSAFHVSPHRTREADQ